MIKMTYVRYRCLKCGAEDVDKFFPDEAITPCLNCWKCHAGQDIKDITEQQIKRIGMFPVEPVHKLAA